MLAAIAPLRITFTGFSTSLLFVSFISTSLIFDYHRSHSTVLCKLSDVEIIGRKFKTLWACVAFYLMISCFGFDPRYRPDDPDAGIGVMRLGVNSIQLVYGRVPLVG